MKGIVEMHRGIDMSCTLSIYPRCKILLYTDITTRNHQCYICMLIMIIATNIYKVRIISGIYSRYLVDWTSLVLCIPLIILTLYIFVAIIIISMQI